MPRSSRRPVTIACAAFLAALSDAAARAEHDDARRQTPPLAGHAAEAAMRDPDAETLHRRLFFDTALREIGPAGVSCDHRARSAPQAITGLGRVDVARDRVTGRLFARVWTPPDRDPGPGATPDEIRARLHALAVEAGAVPDRLVVEGRRFAWCR